MKLVFDKEGKIGLAQNGTIQQDWAYAWGGDNEVGPDRTAEVQSIRSAGPDRAAGVQTLRLTVPARRPANPLFLVEWLSSATGHVRNQLSYFFALGRTSTTRKESIRKTLSTVPAVLLVLGLIIVVAANCHQAPVSGTQAAGECTAINSNSDVSSDKAEATSEEGETAAGTTGQAPFILPSPPQALAAEEKDASSASIVAPAQVQSATASNPSAPSVNTMDLSL